MTNGKAEQFCLYFIILFIFRSIYAMSCISSRNITNLKIVKTRKKSKAVKTIKIVKLRSILMKTSIILFTLHLFNTVYLKSFGFA